MAGFQVTTRGWVWPISDNPQKRDTQYGTKSQTHLRAMAASSLGVQ